MKEYKIRREIPKMVNKEVAVIFKDGLQVWGVVVNWGTKARPRYSINTFKGNSYFLDAVNISAIVRMRVPPQDIKY